MYFDENNNYFIDNDSNTVNNNIIEYVDSINFNRNANKLFNIDEGFNKGNLFENIYSKYKNYVYKLKVNSKKDELLYNIQKYTFALKDLNLYLDVHPTDNSILNEFNTAKNKLYNYKNEYENKYGPLCIENVNSNKNWTWVNNPWPWDKGE